MGRRGGDHRGSAASRRIRKAWLLRTFGDGEKAPCSWCTILLTFTEVEADRKELGGSYARHNIQPACRGCNARRQRPGWTYDGWREAGGDDDHDAGTG